MSRAARVPRRRLSLPKKLTFSAISTCLFFLLLEGLLAISGVRPEAQTTDRFVGFSSYLPLFESHRDASGQEWMVTAENKRHWFNYQQFARKKTAGTMRIFCMGGSTTYGHPYWDSTSFAGWLRESLPIVDRTRQWEVINAGGISYASYRVAALMEELAAYEPDLFIIYSAHNEFLERRTYANLFAQSKTNLQATALLTKTRTWVLVDGLVHRFVTAKPALPPSDDLDVLPGEVDEILNHTVGPVDYHRDDEWQTFVVHEYRANLRRMIQIARKAGARVVFVSPASNEKNCSPFKSELPPTMEFDNKTRFHELLQQARELCQRQAWDRAESVLIKAQALDNQHAELQFLLGQVYLNRQRDDLAQRAFTKARDCDVCPLRATSAIQTGLHEVAQQEAIPIVPFENKLRALARERQGNELLGQEFFLDHVHPTIEANRLLSTWIIETLQAQGIVGGSWPPDAATRAALEQRESEILQSLEPEDEAFAMRNLAKVLHWAGKYAEALPRAYDTLDLIDNDPESRYLIASCLSNLGRSDDALQEYQTLFADGVGYPRAYQPYGELLAAAEHFDEAKTYLLYAILRNPENASAYASLGLVHLKLGEIEFAREALESARKLSPQDSQTLAAMQKLASELAGR